MSDIITASHPSDLGSLVFWLKLIVKPLGRMLLHPLVCPYRKVMNKVKLVRSKLWSHFFRVYSVLLTVSNFQVLVPIFGDRGSRKVIVQRRHYIGQQSRPLKFFFVAIDRWNYYNSKHLQRWSQKNFRVWKHHSLSLRHCLPTGYPNIQIISYFIRFYFFVVRQNNAK